MNVGLCVILFFALIVAIILIISYSKAHKNLFDYPVEVPLKNGKTINYINFDNAASTIPFKNILCKVNKFVPYYSNIHRGAGYCSALSTDIYEKTKEKVKEFIGAPECSSCIYTKNATESLNLLAQIIKSDYLQTSPENVTKNIILVTAMEHHSNLLPWFKIEKDLKKLGYNVKVEVVKIDPITKCLDENDLMNKLTDQVKIFSFTGASNLSGIHLPIRLLTQYARRAGVQYIAVDASQLVAHTRINMEECGIDALIFSAHKMYAPLGLGCLILRSNIASIPEEPPLLQGGGQVELVTDLVDENGLRLIKWKGQCASSLSTEFCPSGNKDEFYESGTANVLGAVALMVAINELEKIGLENIKKREDILYKKTYNELKKLPGIIIVSPNPDDMPTNYEIGGVLSFYSTDMHFNLISTLLSDKYGIGTRAGCFCAHLYTEQILQLSTEQILHTLDEVKSCNTSNVPGFVRVSFAVYNTIEEVDKFITAMYHITNNMVDTSEYESSNGVFTCPVSDKNKEISQTIRTTLLNNN